ncbi:MAG: hypothetical protein NT038_09835 [Euryarchaeota archaeon]|nr:hypothetical protein [Euryarchaeota archaeon]
MMGFLRSDEHAVSEIFGTLLLVIIAVGVFSAISLAVVNPFLSSSETNQRFVTLVGSIDFRPGATPHDRVIVKHCGGQPLPANTRINVTIRNESRDFSYDVVFSSYASWLIGSSKIMDRDNSGILLGDLKNAFVKVVVFDPETNTTVMDKILQDPPYVITLPPVSISETGATFRLSYNFKYINPIALETQPAAVVFEYVIGDDFSSPTKIPVLHLKSSGDVSIPVTLSSGTKYSYRTNLSYKDVITGQIVNILGDSISFWTYQVNRGIYNFESDAPGKINDSSIPWNNGTVHDVSGPSGPHVTHVPGFFSGLALNFSSSTTDNGYVDIPHHDKLDLVDKITINTWIKPNKNDQFMGNLSEIKNTSMFDIIGKRCRDPDIIQVDDDLYAVVYLNGTAGGAFLCIVNINETNGTVATKYAPIDIIDPSIVVLNPRIFKVTDTLYGVVFGSSTDSHPAVWRVITVMIPLSTSPYIMNEFVGAGHLGSKPDIVDLSSNGAWVSFAIAFGGGYSESNDSGYVQTIEINTGTGLVKAVGNWKFQDQYSNPYKYCLEAAIVPVGSTYALAFTEYIGSGRYEGHILVIKIYDDGTMDAMWPPLVEYAYESCFQPYLICVNQDESMYALIYANKEQVGVVQTFNIYPDKIVVIPGGTFNFVVSTSNVDTAVLQVNENLYAIAYTNMANMGMLLTFQIDDDGSIPPYSLDTLTFAKEGFNPSMIPLVGPTKYAVIYGVWKVPDNWNYGFIGVVNIDTAEAVLRPVIKKDGVFSLSTDGRRFVGNITVSEAGIENIVEVSGLVSQLNWNHVVFSYSTLSRNLQLMIAPLGEGTTTYSVSCSGTIKTSVNPLIFGPFYGCLDDVVIRHS